MSIRGGAPRPVRMYTPERSAFLFGKYSGSDIKLDGNEYLIMREDEILGVLTNGASSNGSSKK